MKRRHFFVSAMMSSYLFQVLILSCFLAAVCLAEDQTRTDIAFKHDSSLDTGSEGVDGHTSYGFLRSVELRRVEEQNQRRQEAQKEPKTNPLYYILLRRRQNAGDSSEEQHTGENEESSEVLTESHAGLEDVTDSPGKLPSHTAWHLNRKETTDEEDVFDPLEGHPTIHKLNLKPFIDEELDSREDPEKMWQENPILQRQVMDLMYQQHVKSLKNTNGTATHEEANSKIAQDGAVDDDVSSDHSQPNQLSEKQSLIGLRKPESSRRQTKMLAGRGSLIGPHQSSPITALLATLIQHPKLGTLETQRLLEENPLLRREIVGTEVPDSGKTIREANRGHGSYGKGGAGQKAAGGRPIDLGFWQDTGYGIVPVDPGPPLEPLHKPHKATARRHLFSTDGLPQSTKRIAPVRQTFTPHLPRHVIPAPLRPSTHVQRFPSRNQLLQATTRKRFPSPSFRSQLQLLPHVPQPNKPAAASATQYSLGGTPVPPQLAQSPLFPLLAAIYRRYPSLPPPSSQPPYPGAPRLSFQDLLKSEHLSDSSRDLLLWFYRSLTGYFRDPHAQAHAALPDSKQQTAGAKESTTLEKGTESFEPEETINAWPAPLPAETPENDQVPEISSDFPDRLPETETRSESLPEPEAPRTSLPSGTPTSTVKPIVPESVHPASPSPKTSLASAAEQSQVNLAENSAEVLHPSEVPEGQPGKPLEPETPSHDQSSIQRVREESPIQNQLKKVATSPPVTTQLNSGYFLWVRPNMLARAGPQQFAQKQSIGPVGQESFLEPPNSRFTARLQPSIVRVPPPPGARGPLQLTHRLPPGFVPQALAIRPSTGPQATHIAPSPHGYYYIHPAGRDSHSQPFHPLVFYHPGRPVTGPARASASAPVPSREAPPATTRLELDLAAPAAGPQNQSPSLEYPSPESLRSAHSASNVAALRTEPSGLPVVADPSKRVRIPGSPVFDPATKTSYVYYEVPAGQEKYFRLMPRSVIHPDSSPDFEFFYPVWPSQLPPEVSAEINKQQILWPFGPGGQAGQQGAVALIPYRRAQSQETETVIPADSPLSEIPADSPVSELSDQSTEPSPSPVQEPEQ